MRSHRDHGLGDQSQQPVDTALVRVGDRDVRVHPDRKSRMKVILGISVIYFVLGYPQSMFVN